MRDLVIGDIHAVVDELQDCAALFDCIEEAVKQHKPDRVVFLGDMHHNFAITNVKIIAFYRERLTKLDALLMEVKGESNIIGIVGNHDMPGDGSQYPHALLSYQDLMVVVDEPTAIDEVGFLPYYAKAEDFHAAVAKLPQVKAIYCHQEFDGAKYDNGFYAPHGADPAKMPILTISGHIHTPQSLGRVVYLGAPRWRTISDANIERAIWILDLENHRDTRVDTARYCRRIWTMKLNPQSLFENQVWSGDPSKDLFHVSIEGPPDFVKEQESKARAVLKKIRVSSVITTSRVAHVRESDGVDVAFKKFVGSFTGKQGTSPDKLVELAVRRVYGKPAA